MVEDESNYSSHTSIVDRDDNSRNANVNSPPHYLKGRKETIDVIQDGMTDDEYHGYLKGNVLKYVSRYKFKGEPLEDLKKAQWYLNRLIKEVE